MTTDLRVGLFFSKNPPAFGRFGRVEHWCNCIVTHSSVWLSVRMVDFLGHGRSLEFHENRIKELKRR